MKITFGFSKSKTCQPFSLAIRLVEKRDYSHVYIKYIDELTGMTMVFQASHGDVNIVTFDRFLENNTVVEEYEMELTNDQYLNIRKKMNTYLGLKYSYLQIINITLQKIFKTKNIVIVKDGNNNFICSELGYVILIETNSNIIEDQDSITPSDFNKIIKTLNLKRII